MKILNKESVGKYIIYTLLLDNNTTITVSVVDDSRDEKEIMRDIRILTKDTIGDPFIDTTDVEDYVFEDSKPTLMYIDFNYLTGEVYDQYADVVEMKIDFTVEGTDKARIEDGKLIEDEVDIDTSYFIVAKVGHLEERQERIIFAPVEPTPNETDALKEELTLTNQTLAELMLMIPMMQEMPPMEDIPVDVEETTTEVPIDEPMMEGGVE